MAACAKTGAGRPGRAARAEAVAVYLRINADGDWEVGKSVGDLTARWEQPGTNDPIAPARVLRVRVPVARPRVEDLDLAAPPG